MVVRTVKTKRNIILIFMMKNNLVGFPCQSFSIIAQNPKRLGVKDDRGKLFFEMCRILREKQPKCFIAENVKGILTANKKEAFPLIIKEFENSGYTVKYQILNSANYGVPQKRERVIIVGFRNDLHIDFHFPESIIINTSEFEPLKKVIENRVDEKYYFSQRAVDGMMKRREKMNKGRAQDIEKPCNTVGAHLAKVSLNSTDPVLFENGRYIGVLLRVKSQESSLFLKTSNLSALNTLNIAHWEMQLPR